MLKAGDKAPDFTVKADDGKDVSLSGFRDKRVLLYFFPKANTSG
jgi:peroxiredoxin Q/BCP